MSRRSLFKSTMMLPFSICGTERSDETPLSLFEFGHLGREISSQSGQLPVTIAHLLFQIGHPLMCGRQVRGELVFVGCGGIKRRELRFQFGIPFLGLLQLGSELSRLSCSGLECGGAGLGRSEFGGKLVLVGESTLKVCHLPFQITQAGGILPAFRDQRSDLAVALCQLVFQRPAANGEGLVLFSESCHFVGQPLPVLFQRGEMRFHFLFSREPAAMAIFISAVATNGVLERLDFLTATSGGRRDGDQTKHGLGETHWHSFPHGG